MAFDIQVRSDRIKVKLEALPNEVRGALKTTAQALAGELASTARALAGGTLVQEHTGKYVASIRPGVRTSKNSVTGRIHSRAPQAAILEFGGTIPAHEILPKVAQALAFMGPAGKVFAGRVEHPASTIEKRGVLHAALKDMQGTIVSELTGTVRDVTARISAE